MPILAEKPSFTVDQLMSATDASKRFSEVRRRAKAQPQFITDRNAVDSVVLSYEDYESMYAELATYRESAFLQRAADRLSQGDADRNRQRVSLEDVMGADGYAEYQAIDPDAISDEDLFA